jgi:hypothetical protein
MGGFFLSVLFCMKRCNRHFISHNNFCIEYTSPWTGFEITILVVIGTDCTGSCKFNYHTITTMTAPENYLIMISSMNVALISGVLDTILCDKVCQWLATGQWFSPGTPVSSINQTDRHDITEILLKVTLNTTNLNLSQIIFIKVYIFTNYLLCFFGFCRAIYKKIKIKKNK